VGHPRQRHPARRHPHARLAVGESGFVHGTVLDAGSRVGVAVVAG
jgi:hypothetical protein